MDRLKRQMDFIVEIDKVKNIFRQTYLSDGNRKENDAEHSWHLALMAVLLKEYANEDVDLGRVIPMVLIHDLVEIDAGGHLCLRRSRKATQRARKKRRQSGSSACFPKTRQSGFGNSGRI